MGRLQNFIDNIKENKQRDYLEKNTQKVYGRWDEKDIREALSSIQLSNATLDYIAKYFGVDPSQNPEGFIFTPRSNHLSLKQNMLRMLVGEFLTSDKIEDIKNCMTYTYNQESSRFNGKLNEMSMNLQNKNGADIIIPETLFGKSISLENAFRDVSSLTLSPQIQGQNVVINNLFTNSGLTQIPDLSGSSFKIQEYYFDKDWLDETYILSDDFAENLMYSLNTCKNITPQMKLDFVVEHFADDPSSPNYKLAHAFAENYFKISPNQKYITKQDFDRIQNTINITKPETSLQEKVDFIVSMNCLYDKSSYRLSAPPFEQEIIKTLYEELDLDKTPDVSIDLIKMAPLDSIQISSETIIDDKKNEYLVYKIEAQGNTFLYNTLDNTLTFTYADIPHVCTITDADKKILLDVIQESEKIQTISQDFASDVLNGPSTNSPLQELADNTEPSTNKDEEDPCF